KLEEFLIQLPTPLLQHVRFTDTPGYDGVLPGSRQRAEAAIRRAVARADLCLMVITTGFGAHDLEVALEVRKHCPNLAIVLNMSDQLDSDDVELIQAHYQTELAAALKSTPDWFTVSARWQAASAEERNAIMQERRLLDEPTPHHEWEEIIAFLGAGG